MLSKAELARFLMGLIEVGDAELIDDDSVLSPQICAAYDRAAVRRLRDMMERLYRDFDYLSSPEFIAMVDGKSHAYRAMLTKRWCDPEQRSQQRKAYAEAIVMLLSDSRVYELTPNECHNILDGLRDGFRSATNPDGHNAG